MELAAELELLRMEAELEGRMSLTEPEEWSPEVTDGEQLTKSEP